MKAAMTGSTGFVGTTMKAVFAARGWTIVPVGRKELADPALLDAALEGADLVINLAGAPIVHKWDEEYKKVLYDSRIGTTRILVDTMKRMEKKPACFLSASAVGVYDQEHEHTEESTHFAHDYLATICKDWETTALEAENQGIRTAVFRFGIVIGHGGGILGQMLTPFKMGVGGVIGNGKQPFSWIHAEDLAGAFLFAWEHDTSRGLYNLTAPQPVTNRILTKTLGRLLGRPTLLPVPVFLLKLIFGDGADAIASGQRVLPRRLLDEGFHFCYPTLEAALEASL